jgi:hypothetical protein
MTLGAIIAARMRVLSTSGMPPQAVILRRVPPDEGSGWGLLGARFGRPQWSNPGKKLSDLYSITGSGTGQDQRQVTGAGFSNRIQQQEPAAATRDGSQR